MLKVWKVLPGEVDKLPLALVMDCWLEWLSADWQKMDVVNNTKNGNLSIKTLRKKLKIV